MLDCKGGNPNVVAGYRTAFVSQEHIDLSVMQGCIVSNVQDSNRTLAQKSREQFFVLGPAGASPEPAVQFAEDDHRYCNAFRPLQEGENSPVPALKRRVR